MKSIKILLAAIMIMFASNLLAGCASKNMSEAASQRIMEAQAMKKTVSISLDTITSEDKNTLTLRLTLNNPDHKPITSVQSWLSYNPDVLKGLSIDTKESAFKLTAPYKNDFDPTAGLVMLGRSNASPIADSEITVAELHFQKVGQGTAMIEAYDFRQNLEGHTSVNMMLDGVPANILLKPATPLFISESANNPS